MSWRQVRDVLDVSDGIRCGGLCVDPQMIRLTETCD